MIDCHVHAFPDLADRAVRPLGAILGGAQRVYTWLSGCVPSPMRGLERIARHRAKHGTLVDLVIAGAALPGVMLGGTVDNLLRSMDRHAIRRSLLIAAPPFAENRWVLERCATSAGRLLPVLTLPAVSPTADGTAWTEALSALAESGARGLKIHPNMDAVDSQHVAYRAMFEVARAKKLFIILHTGHFQTPTYRRPGPVEPAAFVHLFEAFRDVPVCLAHMNRDRPEGAWEQLRRFEQLYTDTSWQPAAAIRRAVSEVGVERILLGSDWPLLHGDLQGEVLELAAKAVSDRDLRQIGEANPTRFLGEAA